MYDTLTYKRAQIIQSASISKLCMMYFYFPLYPLILLIHFSVCSVMQYYVIITICTVICIGN